MKTITTAILLSLIVSSHAGDAAPKLSLVQACQIAQQTLDEQKLGPEYFLRSIYLTASGPEAPELQYEAKFEPTIIRRVRVGTTPGPIKYRVIVVTMDGKGAVVEREQTPTASIQRRTISTDAQAQP